MKGLSDDVDILVVGGGPAGSCAAGALARMGASVLLVEGKKFPREHIGESLLAMSMPYLRTLGVAQAIEAENFIRKPGAVFRWGPQGQRMRLGMPHPGYAFQVPRNRFDDLLLTHAQECGARVSQEAWARALVKDDDGRICGAEVHFGEETRHVSARFVLDASGLFRFVPRNLGLTSTMEGRQRIAVGCYYQGAGRPMPPSQDDIITEATENGWLWFIPLDSESTSVGLVTDADLVAERRPQVAMEQAVQGTEVIRDLVRSARISRPARLLRYTNHLVDGPLWGDGYVLAGDTAMFVDPLFSTGVHGALMSGSHAAAGIGAVLGGADEGSIAEWYDAKMREHYHRVNETVRVLYSMQSGAGEFWRRRDLSGVTEEEASAISHRLGVTGAAFFAHAVAEGSLELPPRIARRISEFRTDISVGSCPPDAVPSLSSEVRWHRDWVYEKGRAVRGVVIEHAHRTVKSAEFAENSLLGRMIPLVDGNRSLAAMNQCLGHSPDQVRRSALAVGTLCNAGLLTSVQQDSRQVLTRVSMGS